MSLRASFLPNFLSLSRFVGCVSNYCDSMIAKRSILTGALLTLMFCVILATGFSAQGAFSDDGKRVFFLPTYDHAIWVLDVPSRRTRRINTAELGIPDEVVALSRFTPGKLLCATSSTLFVLEKTLAVAKRECDSPTSAGIEGLAYDAHAKKIVIVTADPPEVEEGSPDQPEGQSLYYHTPGTTFSVQVRCRYIDDVIGPSFGPSGQIYFAARGQDLWRGEIDYETEWPALDAARFAPLATHSGYNGSPMQTGVCETAVAGNHLYAILRRMGGTGWGNVVRLTLLPPQPARKEKSDQVFWRRTGRLVQTTTELTADWCFGLCASPNGKTVFYFDRFGDKASLFLVRNNGKPEGMGTVPLDN